MKRPIGSIGPQPNHVRVCPPAANVPAVSAFPSLGPIIEWYVGDEIRPSIDGYQKAIAAFAEAGLLVADAKTSG